jgi:hypothetical protein
MAMVGGLENWGGGGGVKNGYDMVKIGWGGVKIGWDGVKNCQVGCG